MKALLIAASLASSLAYAETDMPALSKELNIMQGIMKTVLKDDKQRSGLRVNSVETTYLAGQGVLFEVDTNSHGMDFNFNFKDLINMIPGSPKPPAPDNYSIHINMDDNDWDNLADDARDAAREARQQLREKLRDLREQAQQLSWEVRENERQRRDLEFEKSHADGDHKKDLEKQSQSLLEAKKKLMDRQQEISKYAAQLEKEQQQAEDKRKQAEIERYKAFLASFEDNIADVLCKYGAGLKSLPMDENISIVLKDFAQWHDGDEDEDQDKVYIFSNQSVQQCVSGKLSKQKLLSQVKTYQF